MNKIDQIKKERKDLENMLLAKSNNKAAKDVFEALQPFFEKIDSMKSYHPIGRIRLVYLFSESDLSNDKDLFNCYGRFANLVEGVEV
ncbi:hypothetical protein ABHN84_05730 [Shewanella vesiculosa]|uniref:Uncharacterized protein n=1 Tax=Shewanella vesiculosa TaxID=518738 RepID=A0ABV0FLS8_9GAMM